MAESQIPTPDQTIIREVTIPGMGAIRDVQTMAEGYVETDITASDITLYCVRHGSIQLHPSFIPHPIELHSGEAIFLANPKENWSHRITFSPDHQWYELTMGSEQFHQLIMPGFDQRKLESGKGMNLRDLMKRLAVSPSLLMNFEQLVHHKLQAPFKTMFERAKFLEILSLLLDNAFGQPVETCPVAMSPGIEQKLHQIRRHIMDNVQHEPNADALAIQFDLPRQTLKEGFKFVFGRTLHQFYADYKLEWALQRLSSGEWLVKEVAFEIGYQNPSHFIAAFKKKFGFTPKQYLKRELQMS